MCLNIKDRKIYKADEDIICFKGFDIDESTGGLISPIMHMTFELGKTYKRKFFSARSINDYFRIFRFKIPNAVYVVERGFHAYGTYEDAVDRRMTFDTIVKCQIPKGSRYILGKCGEIVSLKIKPLEIVRYPKLWE